MPRIADSDLDGVLCPLITPFTDGAVDHDALTAIIDRALAAGIDGFVPCGTTGEFASLDDEEYRTVLETTVAASGAPVVAGTADTSVRETRARIETAADVGVDAALITLPYFHTANDPAGNRAFIERIADESPLPIYLYNIPSCAGQEIELSVLETVATHERIVGLKDSSGNLNYFGEAVRRTPPNFQVFQGYDSHVLPSLFFGATGGINALTNVIPEAYVAAVEAANASDVETARAIHTNQIAPLFQTCIEHGFAPASKAGLVARGVLESAEVRPPLVAPDEAAQDDIEAVVDAVTSEYP